MNHTHRDTANTEAHTAPPLALVQLTRKRGMSEATFAEVLDRLARRRARALVADEGPGLYSETVAESGFRANQNGVPDCLTCGACCAYFHEVAVLDIDPTPRRLTWAVWETEAIAGPKTRWLRREPFEGHCIAFAGRVGHRASCAIYELRPNSCRAFEAGSDRCHAVRRIYGIEPPLSEIERIEHAGRMQMAADDIAMDQVEALAGRDGASFSAGEQLRLLGEMIDYNRARLIAILREAQRLQALLAERGSAGVAASATCHVNVINIEAQAVASAIARMPVIKYYESPGEAQAEEMNRDLLAVAGQSQTALTRASRWLLALGEVVSATFEMAVELA
jgi:uncharacterized protein